MTLPKLLQVPSAVPIGYAGEAHPSVFPPAYAATYNVVPVYGSPSLLKGAAVETTPHQARYAPHVDHQAYNQYLETVTSAEAPPIPMRGANKVPPGRRVAFKGPQFYYNVKAPSIDDVTKFMAARGPQ